MAQWPQYLAALQEYIDYMYQEQTKAMVLTEHTIEHVERPVQPHICATLQGEWYELMIRLGHERCRPMALNQLMHSIQEQDKQREEKSHLATPLGPKSHTASTSSLNAAAHAGGNNEKSNAGTAKKKKKT